MACTNSNCVRRINAMSEQILIQEETISQQQLLINELTQKLKDRPVVDGSTAGQLMSLSQTANQTSNVDVFRLVSKCSDVLHYCRDYRSKLKIYVDTFKETLSSNNQQIIFVQKIIAQLSQLQNVVNGQDVRQQIFELKSAYHPFCEKLSLIQQQIQDLSRKLQSNNQNLALSLVEPLVEQQVPMRPETTFDVNFMTKSAQKSPLSLQLNQLGKLLNKSEAVLIENDDEEEQNQYLSLTRTAIESQQQSQASQQFPKQENLIQLLVQASQSAKLQSKLFLAPAITLQFEAEFVVRKLAAHFAVEFIPEFRGRNVTLLKQVIKSEQLSDEFEKYVANYVIGSWSQQFEVAYWQFVTARVQKHQYFETAISEVVRLLQFDDVDTFQVFDAVNLANSGLKLFACFLALRLRGFRLPKGITQVIQTIQGAKIEAADREKLGKYFEVEDQGQAELSCCMAPLEREGEVIKAKLQ